MKPMKEEHLTVLRRHMVEVIAIHTDLASEELGKATLDERVRAAMRRMPRHLFVPASVALRASIGCSLCLTRACRCSVMPAKGVGIRANAEFATRRDACEDRAASSC